MVPSQKFCKFTVSTFDNAVSSLSQGGDCIAIWAQIWELQYFSSLPHGFLKQ